MGRQVPGLLEIWRQLEPALKQTHCWMRPWPLVQSPGPLCSDSGDQVIRHHLHTVGLGEFFLPAQTFGQDSQELIEVGHKKARLIQRLLFDHALPATGAIFVDDSGSHIALCRELDVCECLHVQGNGLSEEEIQALEDRLPDRDGN